MTPEPSTLVSTQGLEVHFPPNVRLRFPDLRLEPSQETTLVGPSGSGKSTLLHVLSGLIRPQQGAVRIHEQNLNDLSIADLETFRARHIGIIFQDFHLIDGYTALENVMVGLAAAGTPLRQAQKRAEETLRRLDLGHRTHHSPKRLSTGERQRVAIARAVIGNPSLLLADEPTANLDRSRAEAALHLLRELAQEHQAALVIATHDPLVIQSIHTTISLVTQET